MNHEQATKIPLINTLAKILRSIETSEFLASQASTCKIELAIRDYLYFKLSKQEDFTPKKEVTGYGKSSRASCDLAIFKDAECSDLIQLIELKQYYIEDTISKENSAYGVLRPLLIDDSNKYDPAMPFLGVLLLVGFDCSRESFESHGDQQFKYFQSFNRIRGRFEHSYQRMASECKVRLKACLKESFPEFKLEQMFESDLGSYKGINSKLLTVIVSR